MNYVWVSFISKFDQKEKERITLLTRVKRKCLCLLNIEALNTTINHIDDVQITVTIER